MPQANGIKQLAWVDCKGGGQVTVANNIAYVGHTKGPEATTIIDVSDPRKPKLLTTINCAHSGVHAHKVRVVDDIMVTNYESIAYAGEPQEGFKGGIHIYDVSTPSQPKHITHWKTEGEGVHRFSFDGEYAYISPTVEGYAGHICMILDVRDPTKPREVGRWHWPGQHRAAGEKPAGSRDEMGEHVRCHHPIRRGDRLYVSYWLAGWAILDISDMSKPKEVARVHKPKAFPAPSHSVVPVPFKLHGMEMVLVADEDVARRQEDGPAFMWLVNIDDETDPVTIGSFQIDGIETRKPAPPHTGCHQPVEIIRSTEVPVAWFWNGLRVVDIANPHAPKEVASYVPDPPPGAKHPVSNDVYEDDRGIIYLMDRDRGLHLLERA
jgi:hypothetical protein